MEILDRKEIEDMLGGVVAGASGDVKPLGETNTVTVHPNGSTNGDHVKGVDVGN